ncbi:cilia- and flagella-associated protein 74 isoform X2 [Nematostella vectensis]|uniref:cilia- and flagella-associated protein 74 isoform X2 n=1 Tax=Nematostella vectensis TaxID=45351 RepID=UPI002076E221|nr:cilia- and flagella-associated protein 74 isoform X2 [Nematostella vectensis]
MEEASLEEAPTMSETEKAELSDLEYQPSAEDEDEEEGMAPKTNQAKSVSYRDVLWSSDGGQVDYESDPSSDVDRDYFSDEGSLTGIEGGELEDEYASDPIVQQTRQEKLRLLALRRHLDQLSEQVLEKDYMVKQFRQELVKCRDHTLGLEKEIDDVRKKIEDAENRQYMASLGRLNSQYSKLCSELAAEKDVEKQILKQLDDAEYALAQATVEQGKFLVAGEEVERNEKMAERHKTEASATRIRKENANAALADRRRKTREKEHVAALRERERKHRHALAAAKRNREQASKFLKETMSRVRQQEAEDEDRSRDDLENRIGAVLSLKRNIETNRENLRALQARDAKLALELEEEEERERLEILEEGLNPDEIMTRRKRIRQFEKDKEAFEKRQRERQVEIADNILKEEKQMKKRYQQQPQLWPEKQRSKRITRRRPKPKFFKSTSGSSSMEYSADVEDIGEHLYSGRLVAVSSDDDDDFSPYGETSRDEAKEGDSEGEDGEELAMPEFRGLWEEQGEQGGEKRVRKLQFATHAPTKMEQEIMEQSLMKQRAGIVQKQVAAGREFKGCAFYSKPEVIVFKDFDVGKSYRKKVLLTNISYTQNFCKYLGMSHVLKDFIEVAFDPPGVMSAGLTCDFSVTFNPMLNENLEGQIDFLAQTGPFSVPIKCMTKKCQLSVDAVEVDFGSQVVGETRKKVVVLTNSGALGTEFEFLKITGLDRSDVTSELSSIGGMTNPDETEGEAAEQPSDGPVGDGPQEASVTDATIDKEGERGDTPAVEAAPGTMVTFDEPPGSNDTPDQQEEAEAQPDESGPVAMGSPVPTEVTVMEGLRVGKVVSGSIAPFSTVQLEVVFAPVKSGSTMADFEISFSDPLSPPIMLRGRGNGIDVPVWVERELVDLKICMYDRLYQDAILVHNRATSALRLKFEVCKELRNHLELLPKMAYIQAGSQFSAQLKFLPRLSLLEDCKEYFDPETGVLDAPMVIRVADQTRPVPFTVRSVVTSSDIEFSVKELDFGFCTVYESVRHTVTLTNKSVLPQPYGFCGVPDTVDVQPNDGFGTLLPLESLDVDIIFNAKKAKEYTFELTCKSGIGREFKLPCRAVGVLPPLEFSHSVVEMKATAVGDTSSTHLEVMNSHTSANEFTHPVPRIGTGPIVDVGPTSFEFVVPDGAPLTVSPAVGTVNPGQRCIIHVTFTPVLDPDEVRKEAVKILEREAEAERKRKEAASPAEKTQESPSTQKKKGGKSGGKSAKVSPKPTATPATPTQSGKQSAKSPVKLLTVDEIKEGSDAYEQAHLSLLRSFTNSFNRYTIPCFVAPGRCSAPGTLTCSIHNTLYLDVRCPTVQSSVVVMSDNGRTVADFGNVSIGRSELKTVTIQNISDQTVHLSASLLDPLGPFQMLNALRVLEPQATHTVVMSFGPCAPSEYHEVLEIRCPKNTLYIRLKGKGVTPVISLSVEGGVLDLGDALVNDTVTTTFKMSNTSELSISYNLKLDSLSPLRHSRAQVLPRFLQPYNDLAETNQHVVGPSNFNGLAVIDCVPAQGTIGAGETKEITVTFTPDHPSEHYADEMAVEINNGERAHTVKLIGRAWPHIVYVRGWDELTPCVESLVPDGDEQEDEDQKAEQKTVLLTFKSYSTPEGFLAAERILEIGSIRSSTQTKKSSDFFFDNPKEANEKGFTFDPMKAGVDIGVKRDVVCKWLPPPGHDPNEPVNTSTMLTVKADVTTQYKILLKGLITTDPSAAHAQLEAADKQSGTADSKS